MQYRQAFANAMKALATIDPRTVLVESDIASPARQMFHDANFKFINTGITEANAVGICAGLASEGYLPYWYTYGFLIGRAYDQIRQSVAQNHANVRMIGYNCGVSGVGGASHNCVDDIGLMRLIPGISIVVPADAVQTYNSLLNTRNHNGPIYFRFPRGEEYNVTTNIEFKLGTANVLRTGKETTILCNGPMVSKALEASVITHSEVINVSTVKPLDSATILKSAKKTGRVVVAEEHSVIGGLGDSVVSLLSPYCNIATVKIGVEDVFTQSGKGDLMAKYGLTSEAIVKACKSLMEMKI